MNYNKLSKEYDKLFFQNINQFQKKWLSEGNEKTSFDFFYPSYGVKANEKCEFLIYGQAANGWESKFTTTKKRVLKNVIKEGISYSNEYFVEGNHSPLDWVNVYWTKNTYQTEIKKSKAANKFYKKDYEYTAYSSFFWKLNRQLISEYYGLDEEGFDWSKKMIWSNLYKIAPHRRNPSIYEQELQREYSIELMKKEIEEIKPKYCIVMTNESWWEPFRQKLNTTRLDNHCTPQIISFELYKKTKIILTTRPRFGSTDKHVSKILKLISG